MLRKKGYVVVVVVVVVHLVLHIASEAKIGGPVCYRSMYFVERYAVLYIFRGSFFYFLLCIII